MKKLTKMLALLLALCMVAGLLTACGGETTTDEETTAASETASGQTSAEGSQYGGHLDARSCSTMHYIDPLKMTGVWNYQFETCVFENVLTRDADNNICPGVCDFELSDDQLTLVLWVREGKTFSNGNAVTIEDVKASIDRSLSRYSSIVKKVAPYVASETIDGDKLTIVFSEYNAACMHYIASYQTWIAVMPKEICEKYAENYITDQVEDAIGTGPYVFTEFQDAVKITVTKRTDYTPMEEDKDRSGFAGTKYGYMDSITFWSNSVDSSAALALLSGEYDIVEVIPSEYTAMAEAQGIKCETFDSNSTTFVIFNCLGSNACSKYPALRKAIMAAIDYVPFLDTVTDGSAINNTNLVLTPSLDNGAFTSADYYGAANQEVVDKYMAEARAQGYDDEPVQIVFNNKKTTIATLFGDYLQKAGINYQSQSMESSAYSTFTADNGNAWDCIFSWINVTYRPELLDSNIAEKHYTNDEATKIKDAMMLCDVDSQEYQDYWTQLSAIWVDDCPFGFMSRIDWWWWSPNELHTNGDSVQPYLYNAYWDDPQNHTN